MPALLERANRNSGSWLPQVTNCPSRFFPCGNPGCADEAMRAGELRSNRNYLSNLQAAQAEKHSHQIAATCGAGNQLCPLVQAFHQDRHTVLSSLIDRFDSTKP